MQNFNNPLDNIKIASPCSADWREMYGDARKRFCADCKLNVYNLSEMTKTEAESFLINSEGRVCVRLYRRADGTVLTQDCPVGWAKVKQRVSRITTAAFSMVAGFFGGFAAFSQFTNIDQDLLEKVSVEESSDSNDSQRLLIEVKPLVYEEQTWTVGKLNVPLAEDKTEKPKQAASTRKEILRSKGKIKNGQWANGRVENIRRIEDEPVELWIK